MENNNSLLSPLLVRDIERKIVLVVLDGLGGLPNSEGKTELETAHTPHLDELAGRSSLGLLDPIFPGITPGSGPAHLALFGYDPLEYIVGRGVLSALGVNFPLQPGDVAARVNFCTLDTQGRVVDRRAGRITTEECQRLVGVLQGFSSEGVEFFLQAVRDYRAVLVLRGPNLSAALTETDPQNTGVSPLPLKAQKPEGERTAKLINQFLSWAHERIKKEPKANGLLLRGFDRYHPLPLFGERFGLRPCALAVYPMYKGVARLVGMDVVNDLESWQQQLEALDQHYQQYDFFYLHYKQTDSRGEDGDFAAKVKAIEEVDRTLPHIVSKKPAVLAITGDHSTPSVYRAHSWHPVPLLLHAAFVRYQSHLQFCEAHCAQGDLGRMAAKNLIYLLLAASGRLKKFGA